MKKLVSLLVSLAILFIVYTTLDVATIASVLRRTDPGLLGLSLVLLLGLVLLSAVRLYLLARTGGFHMSRRMAIQATLVANALNMFLPGKLGDILKASVMAEGNSDSLARATSLGIWEKLSDLVALFLMAAVPLAIVGTDIRGLVLMAVLGIAGLTCLLVPAILRLPLSRLKGARTLAKDWGEVIVGLRARPRALALNLAMTAFLWIGHLVQIALLAASLGVSGDPAFWMWFMGQLPIAIVAGLVPLTFAGVGTRDAAIVALLGPQIGAETAAALGILFFLRYLVPGLIGAPLLPRFLRVSAQHRKILGR